MFASRVTPLLSRWKNSRRKGVTALPRTCAASAAARPSCSSRSCRAGSTCSSGGQRVGHHDAAVVGAEPGPLCHHGRDLLGAVDPPVDAVAGVAEVEARERRRCRSRGRHAEGLQPLQGGGHVEDRLHAGADDRDVGGGEGLQVGGLVPGAAGVAVDPAEAAGREDRDAGAGSEVRGRRNGCCAHAAARRHGGEVAGAHLDDVVPGRPPAPEPGRPARCTAGRRPARWSPGRRRPGVRPARSHARHAGSRDGGGRD